MRRTLKGHTGQVTTVKLIDEDDHACVLVSGDSTGEVRIWTIDSSDQVRNSTLWVTKAPCQLSLQYTSIVVQAHKGSISALGVTGHAGAFQKHLFTGGSDGLIKLWKLGDGKPELKQTINLKGKLPLDLEVATLPGSQGM